MDAQTQTAKTIILAGKPVRLPTGEEIYDALMSKIEPELVSGNIPKLAQTYADETAEHKKERLAHYQEAYAQYDAAYAEWQKSLTAAITQYRKVAIRSAEAADRKEEETTLANLDTIFSA